ncbi:hypothetical protein QK289_08835 [Exiguobacterium antarcticum]|uniref:Lipoprotein n=1 Tax=Exiguobacterium antarcticum TaxID=132920 RepID=A0ABT6R2N7_9BACL|nr:hypothetical protein [Exiguobacterium antarcticum]MDI3235108.1 hypothetical protein [Exiguobacterium antarcticum]
MKKLLLGLLIAATALAGCGVDASTQVKDTSYDGTYLKIAVIGEQPNLQEKNVKFSTLSFEDLEDTNRISSKFDAVFIAKNNLKQADEEKYVKVYRKLDVPTFFLETTKGFLPFVSEDLTYATASELEHSYASGYLQEKKDSYRYWEYGLNNDQKNNKNVKDVYSRIFETIAEVKE